MYKHKTTGRLITMDTYLSLPLSLQQDYSYTSLSTPTEQPQSSNSDFVTSAVVGAVTGSAILGGLLGGDLLGGVVGDMLDGDLFD